MPADFLTPRSIKVETAHYVIRSVDTADAQEGWCDWLLDPHAQRMLNASARRMTLDEIRAYIAGFDRKTAHLLGIFERDTGRIVGLRVVYIDPVHKEYLVNILIGEPDARGKGARRETRFAMHNFMFEELGLEAARCTVLADNSEMLGVLAANGWVHEHTSTKPRADGAGITQIHHFRLTREVWQATQADRARRDQQREASGPIASAGRSRIGRSEPETA